MNKLNFHFTSFLSQSSYYVYQFGNYLIANSGKVTVLHNGDPKMKKKKAMVLILKEQWLFKLFTGCIKWLGVLLVYFVCGSGMLKKIPRQLRISQDKVTIRNPEKILCWRTKGKTYRNTRWANCCCCCF